MNNTESIQPSAFGFNTFISSFLSFQLLAIAQSRRMKLAIGHTFISARPDPVLCSGLIKHLQTAGRETSPWRHTLLPACWHTAAAYQASTYAVLQMTFRAAESNDGIQVSNQPFGNDSTGCMSYCSGHRRCNDQLTAPSSTDSAADMVFSFDSLQVWPLKFFHASCLSSWFLRSPVTRLTTPRDTGLGQ